MVQKKTIIFHSDFLKGHPSDRSVQQNPTLFSFYPFLYGCFNHQCCMGMEYPADRVYVLTFKTTVFQNHFFLIFFKNNDILEDKTPPLPLLKYNPSLPLYYTKKIKPHFSAKCVSISLISQVFVTKIQKKHFLCFL